MKAVWNTDIEELEGTNVGFAVWLKPLLTNSNCSLEVHCAFALAQSRLVGFRRYLLRAYVVYIVFSPFIYGSHCLLQGPTPRLDMAGFI